MMSWIKKTGLAVLILFAGIQFIQPAPNKNGQALPEGISNKMVTPRNIQPLLQKACFDCHSNHTDYPWYASIQPVGWLLDNHIKKGKAELNFDEFGNYSERRQQSKLKSIASQVRDDKMPLSTYTFLHKEARLTKDQKELIIDWALNLKDSLEQNNQ